VAPFDGDVDGCQPTVDGRPDSVAGAADGLLTSPDRTDRRLAKAADRPLRAPGRLRREPKMSTTGIACPPNPGGCPHGTPGRGVTRRPSRVPIAITPA